MTSTDHTVAHAWPACVLGAWAAAWLGGRRSPDDVVDTLAELGARHIVDDRTVPAPGRESAGGSSDSGTESPGDAHDGALRLLGLLRDARSISVRLPGPGDLHGLPPDPATSAAIRAGEVLLIDDGDPAGAPLALVPHGPDDQAARNLGHTFRWSVFRYGAPVAVSASATADAGAIEYELRQAVSQAAALIAGLGANRAAAEPGAAPPRDLRATVRTRAIRYRVDLPPHDDARASRMIETAAQVDAIVAAATDDGVTFGASGSQLHAGDTELRRLAGLTRAARAAAVNRIIGEYLSADR
ncbi:hypothetical protein GCM10009624_07040 [Gordonia sinesedis]